jgi:hypothetical protein
MHSGKQSLRSRRWRCLADHLTVVIAVGLSGCGGNPTDRMTFYPVKGKVVLPDGKPLTSGKVVFVATEFSLMSPSDIGSDGTFELKGQKDGLPAGEYRVRIDPGGVTGGAGTHRKVARPFAGKYTDEDASGLKAQVKPGENDFEFKLTK